MLVPGPGRHDENVVFLPVVAPPGNGRITGAFGNIVDDRAGVAVMYTAFAELLRTMAMLTEWRAAIFAASLLGYFAWNTRRMITEQIIDTVNAENNELSEIYTRRGLQRLTSTIDSRALRPGANLYLVTTPTGQAVAGNVGALAPGVMASSGWSDALIGRSRSPPERSPAR